MDVLRYTRNVWGQEVLEGISWDLIPVFVGAAILFISAHLIYKRVLDRRS